jgi:DNA-binding NtrC family response regulator
MDARAMAELATAHPSFALQRGNQGLSPRASSPHFLIATDDDDLHKIVNDAVIRLSYTAAFVRSGSAAMTSARSHALSLVLLDQCLPDLAGLEVARALSRDAPDLPFVLIGGGLTTSITVEAMKLGAFTVLEKPVALHDVMATIRSAMVESRTASPPSAPYPSDGRCTSSRRATQTATSGLSAPGHRLRG